MSYIRRRAPERFSNAAHSLAGLAQSVFDSAFELAPELLAVFTIDKAGIRGEIFAADELAQFLELPLLIRRDIEKPGAGLESPRRARRHIFIAHRFRGHAGNKPVRHSPTHRHQGRFEHGYVDELAFIASLAAEQCCGDGKCRGETADGVGDGKAELARRESLSPVMLMTPVGPLIGVAGLSFTGRLPKPEICSKSSRFDLISSAIRVRAILTPGRKFSTAIRLATAAKDFCPASIFPIDGYRAFAAFCARKTLPSICDQSASRPTPREIA